MLECSTEESKFKPSNRPELKYGGEPSSSKHFGIFSAERVLTRSLDGDKSRKKQVSKCSN